MGLEAAASDPELPGTSAWQAVVPNSNRALQAGITAADEKSEQQAAEYRACLSEVRSLSARLPEAEALGLEVAESQEALRTKLVLQSSEAAELWASHEGPLSAQEEQLSASAVLVQRLRNAERHSEARSAALHAECCELRHRGKDVYRQTGDVRTTYESYTGHVARAAGRARDMAKHRDRGEEELQAAHKTAIWHRRTRDGLDQEVAQGRVELDTLRHELKAMDRHCHTHVTSWWEVQRQSCESLVSENAVLRRELQRTESALDMQCQESATWRERAYRAESGLCSQQATDVTAGIRALNARLELHTQQVAREKSDVGLNVALGGDIRYQQRT